MLLSDVAIVESIEAHHIQIEPFDPKMIQPASIDLKLGGDFLEFDDKNEPHEVWGRRYLKPGEFILGSTVEWIKLPADIAAKFEGKSSLGRIGLLTHITAGFIDPGFHGNITLELRNVSFHPIDLKPHMPIGQLCFMPLDRPSRRPYGTPGLGSHYQGQFGVTPARSGITT